ncbi:hypothetical protein [Fructilactobacillus florum]|uniref:hypothetical protein n=1 Tax=Fructilactobacillus florum TaxID=640331 RepID=UPI0006D0B089|nr:hypothetical protein [Fructilactobacillus florum]
MLSLAGTTALVYLKKRQQAHENAIKAALLPTIKTVFNNQEINGYWIDFENQRGLEYEGGVKVTDRTSGVQEAYTFLFNPTTKEIYHIKPVTTV